MHYSTVVWSQDGVDTPLLTTFVSSSQLTATVPAALLASPVTGNVLVQIWDRIENTLVASSSRVPFQVTSTPTTPNGDVMGMSDGFFGYPRSNSITLTVGP